MQLQESGEMYLETILVLTQAGRPVRSVDVGEYMGYSKPSVSRAVGLLKTGGFLAVQEDGTLILTPLGMDVAQKIYDRHTVLTKALVKLGVEESVAAEDACKIEHDISDASFDAIRRCLCPEE